MGLRRLAARLGRGRAGPAGAAPAPATPRGPAFPPRRVAGCGHADERRRAVIAAARDLPDGTPASDELVAALRAEIAARRDGAAMADGPASPVFSNLQIRHRDVPDWWEESGSLLLAAPDAKIDIQLGMGLIRTSNALLVVGANTLPPRFDVLGTDGMAVIGDHVTMLASSFTVGEEATLLVGEKTTGTWMAFADARNAGMLIVGADCMFAAGIVMRTDDTHAIRDAETDARINIRGGRIMIEDHVWIGEGTRIMGDTRIQPGAVVGASSLVKGVLPAGTISAGQPARPRRGGIVWTREDGP